MTSCAFPPAHRITLTKGVIEAGTKNTDFVFSVGFTLPGHFYNTHNRPSILTHAYLEEAKFDN